MYFFFFMAQHACMCKKWAFFFLVSPIFLQQQQHTFVVHLLEFLSFVTIHSFNFLFSSKKNCSRIKRKALSHNNNIHSFFLFHFLFSILTKIKRWTWFMVKTNVNIFLKEKNYTYLTLRLETFKTKKKRIQKKKYLFISTKKINKRNANEPLKKTTLNI